jgi:hypothetical protein
MVARRVLPLALPERESSPRGQSINDILSQTADFKVNARLRLCENLRVRARRYGRFDRIRIAQSRVAQAFSKGKRWDNSRKGFASCPTAHCSGAWAESAPGLFSRLPVWEGNELRLHSIR